MHRCKLSSALGLVLVAGLALAPRTARADDATVLAADLDLTGGIGERGVRAGQGGNIRLGRKLDLVLASFTPELGAAYHRFGGPAQAHLNQGIVGARVRFGKVLEPGAYAHLGYGWLDVSNGTASSDGFSGVSADAGLSLDLTLLPVLDLGVHAGYNGILASSTHPAFDTYVAGVDVGLVF